MVQLYKFQPEKYHAYKQEYIFYDFHEVIEIIHFL